MLSLPLVETPALSKRSGRSSAVRATRCCRSPSRNGAGRSVVARVPGSIDLPQQPALTKVNPATGGLPHESRGRRRRARDVVGWYRPPADLADALENRVTKHRRMTGFRCTISAPLRLDSAMTGPWRSTQDFPCWLALNDWFAAINLNSALARDGQKRPQRIALDCGQSSADRIGASSPGAICATP